MPYLSKTFSHVIADSSASEWDYEKKTGETITYNSWMSEGKYFSDQFFSDLKELLQQTDLTITFDDENNVFNIFDIDFTLKCLFSTNYNYWTNNNYWSYCGIRPVIILPRISNAVNCTTSTNYNYSLERFGYNAITSTQTCSIYNTSYHWINCNTSCDDEIKRQVNYTIKIYYNTNYIICSYIGFTGYEIPLFCFIQGEIKSTKQKAVYLSSCINTYDSNFLHEIAIPSQNMDKTKYYDYLPSLGNTSKLGSNAIFDTIQYPSIDILNKLSSGGINNDVYLNKLTAYGGIITFDNVFDVSRISSSNLSPQFLTNATYTINGENYYCPGSTVSPYNNDRSSNGRYIFKL